MSKRIVFSNYDDQNNPYYAGGGAYAIHQVAKRLAKNNQVTVITGRYPGSSNQKIDGVMYQRIGLTTLGPKLGQVLFQLLLPFYAWKKQSDYDVWFESFTPPFSTACLQLFTKKRVVGLMHNLSGKDMQEKYHLPFLFFERLGLKKYHEVVALTEVKKKQIMAEGYQGKIWQISNAVDFIPGKKTKKTNPYILFIGRLDITQKGLDLLIEAFAQVAQQIKFDLHIAGAGTSEDQQKLKSMINEHKLTKRVKLLGKLNSQAKADAFENAEFLVLPSRYEGQGITFLEGIAYDKVIVCFDIADMSWLSSKIAEKCSAFSVSELATAIKRLASDPVYKNQKLVALKAQKGQYIFNWDKITDKYTQLLNAKKEKNKEGNTYDN